MCDPVSVLLASAGGAAISKYQSDKQEALMREQAEDARKLRERQEAQFKLEQRKAEAVPLLKRNASQKSRSKGIAGLKVPKVASAGGGYNSVGMGGSSGTGVNIPK